MQRLLGREVVAALEGTFAPTRAAFEHIRTVGESDAGPRSTWGVTTNGPR
ncbi:hypothetical protein [Paractinoplanes abujensis]|uniref:Uncharacterized protein n=1 Tax=Paractinoplanes abujensis TaxID=882441 RepID=A0A7W7G0P6_9ACTN|nr:hypothetical protein [Actinoplanes abujensis]MBB4691390.1 hypothetical protein [Actinoplanes abujensis]